MPRRQPSWPGLLLSGLGRVAASGRVLSSMGAVVRRMFRSERAWSAAVGISVVLFAALAGVLAARNWVPFGFERAAVGWCAAHRPPVIRSAAVVFTSFGTGVVPYLTALAAGTVVVRAPAAPRRRWRTVLLLMGPVLWLAGGELVRAGLMHAFGRPRPARANWATTASGFSFPSGHSFTSAVSAGLLVVALIRVRPTVARACVTGAALFVFLIGLSRVYLGVHWPLDVVGGWLLACAWLAAGLPFLPPRQPIVPGPDSGEPGVPGA
ncbi:phosphatase PAP2 family protein [Streptomyces sp. SP17BM10]|uniref:phosphatase PAP2 family protein n=1 Tax=Streptomyces sp. SP17BM10 TaxID=3002530 RepID=UPI002E78C950|nr:phosphatase PAP2 family protein [Streptomyces sp. SP17BM10]MEE1782145.1 phosphatase PAP2 family protein [Streptomyces sp. SP17BM10]